MNDECNLGNIRRSNRLYIKCSYKKSIHKNWFLKEISSLITAPKCEIIKNDKEICQAQIKKIINIPIISLNRSLNIFDCPILDNQKIDNVLSALNLSNNTKLNALKCSNQSPNTLRKKNPLLKLILKKSEKNIFLKCKPMLKIKNPNLKVPPKHDLINKMITKKIYKKAKVVDIDKSFASNSKRENMKINVGSKKEIVCAKSDDSIFKYMQYPCHMEKCVISGKCVNPSFIKINRNTNKWGPICSEESCQLGCVCRSLLVGRPKIKHCNKAYCLFGCVCGNKCLRAIYDNNNNNNSHVLPSKRLRKPPLFYGEMIYQFKKIKSHSSFIDAGAGSFDKNVVAIPEPRKKCYLYKARQPFSRTNLENVIIIDMDKISENMCKVIINQQILIKIWYYYLLSKNSKLYATSTLYKFFEYVKAHLHKLFFRRCLI
ncbi:unnamed protein product [Gordionus sp. m RMFG-2023]